MKNFLLSSDWDIYNISKGAKSRTFSCDGEFNVLKIGEEILIVPITRCFHEDEVGKAFKHDCDNCTYLFSVDRYLAAIIDGVESSEALKIEKHWEVMYDCYICIGADLLDYNIVIRYGDTPSSYYSGRSFNKNAKSGKLLKYVDEYILDSNLVKECNVEKEEDVEKRNVLFSKGDKMKDKFTDIKVGGCTVSSNYCRSKKKG